MGVTPTPVPTPTTYPAGFWESDSASSWDPMQYTSQMPSSYWSSPWTPTGDTPTYNAPPPEPAVATEPVEPAQYAPSEQDQARQILSDMDAGRIIWDDNLRSWANNVLSGPAGADWGALEAERQRVRESIGAVYEPIFTELDRRTGLLPEQKTVLEQQVGDIYTYLGGEITRGAEAPRASIGAARGIETERSAQSLRELAESGRGFLKAASGQYAGTSGVAAVTTGMAKRMTQERGKMLRQRDQVLAQLDQKMVDVDREVTSEKAKIDLWKGNQLVDITQEIDRRREEIAGQRVGAGTAQAADLNALELQLFQTTQDRLLALDQQVRSYNDAIDLYREQRTVDLQNYVGQLKAIATYSPPSYGWDLSQLTPSKVQTIATGTGQPTTWGGYQFQPTGKAPIEVGGVIYEWDATTQSYKPTAG